MTGTGARLYRCVRGTAGRGDVRSGRERRRWACLTGALAASAALVGVGCTDIGSVPTSASMTPAIAYSDVAVPVSVDAPMLRSGLVVDIDSESAHYDDSTIHLALVGEDPGLLSSVALGPVQQIPGPTGPTFLTTIPAGVKAGTYGLRVTAPNGRSVISPAAFQELGPDTVDPVVTIDTPPPLGTLGIGSTSTNVTISFHVDDGFGELSTVTWLASNGASGICALSAQTLTNAPPAQAKCPVPITIAPLDPAAGLAVPFSFQAYAVDMAGHMGAADVEFFLASLPSIASFEPTYGSLAGHQALTIHGAYFSNDAQAFIEGSALIGAAPENRVGGDVQDSNTIFGFTPQNARPHEATVSVTTVAGVTDAQSGYRYTAPPHPRLIQPATGPTTGGILVTVAGNDLLDGVMIAFGTTLDNAMPLYKAMYSSNDKVVGCLPPGPAGVVTIWANDSVTGAGSLVGAFTYSDDLDPSAIVSPDCLPAATP